MCSKDIEGLFCDVRKKAMRNQDHQAFVQPSQYGFGKMQEDMENCRRILIGYPDVIKVDVAGKDLLSVIFK